MVLTAARRYWPELSGAALMAALAAYQYAPAARQTLAAWETDDFSHGGLVSLVAALWIVRTLQRSGSALTPTASGLWLLLGGLAINQFGFMSASDWLSGMSFIAVLAGAAAFFCGWRCVAHLAAPLCLLAFAVPPPRMLYPKLTMGLQLASSSLSAAGLRLADIPVFLDGNIIDLGTVKLQVAEACSGLRFLLPLLAISYIMAFAFLRQAWKRGLLVALAVPVTIAMNSLRIFFIGITVTYWGVGAAEGLIHDAEGFIVFAVSFVIIGGIAFAMAGRAAARAETGPLFDFIMPRWQPLLRGGEKVAPRLWLAAAVVMAVSFGIAWKTQNGRAMDVPARVPFASFPLQFGDWHGRRAFLPEYEEKLLRADDYVLADYERAGQFQPVNLLITYYAHQKQGSAVHAPETCIEGSGWEISSAGRVTLAPANPPRPPLVASKAVITKGAQSVLVVYWFRERGVDIASPLMAKWLMVKDFLHSGRSDGGLVRLSVPIVQGQDQQAAREQVEAFVKDMLVYLDAFLP